MTLDATSPRYRFGMRFALLARSWRRFLDRHIAAAGLSDATWVPLVHLQETGGGITQKELANLVGIDTSSLVRLIDILSRQGLVERRVDTKDARARLIFLTADGEERVGEIQQELCRVEEELLADLADKDLEEMLAKFSKIETRLREVQTRQEHEGTR